MRPTRGLFLLQNFLDGRHSLSHNDGSRVRERLFVRQYIALNKMERFEKVPHGRYINFVAEFLAAEKGSTRADAIAAWTELKAMDAPKSYASWVKARAKRRETAR